jgi:hypothetical protein
MISTHTKDFYEILNFFADFPSGVICKLHILR